ncbi:MAG: hypothetical protein WCT04_10380 [Planctomycetota bacterium]
MKTTERDLNPNENERLLAILIDGDPSTEDAAKINNLMTRDDAFRTAYLERLDIHAMLAWQFHAADAAKVQRISRWEFLRHQALRWAAVILLVAGMASYFVLRGETASAACLRLIQANETSGDRTYRISAVYDSSVPKPWDTGPRDPHRAPLPSINGATLHVGSGDRFVLFRKYNNGEALIAGFDGTHAWSIRGDGAVRLSKNKARFRGDIPGVERGVPFTDMRSNLQHIQEAYTLDILAPETLSGSSTERSHHLHGVKRSPDFRGPAFIDIYFDASSGVIQRMTFDNMPLQNGGPVRATLELIEQRNQPSTWYEHAAHHEAGREVDRVD